MLHPVPYKKTSKETYIKTTTAVNHRTVKGERSSFNLHVPSADGSFNVSFFHRYLLSSNEVSFDQAKNCDYCYQLFFIYRVVQKSPYSLVFYKPTGQKTSVHK